MNKTALITGVSGQDGAYLARFLLSRGYRVVGTSRDAQMASFSGLRRLGILERVERESMALNDFRSVFQVLTRVKPDEIYNLAGQSSVGLSFEQPIETFESITVGVLNLLEAIRLTSKEIRLYNACSSECFGDTQGQPAQEETPFRPRSPYGTAKAAAFHSVVNYREAYGIAACSGILFNHESPLRPERFVTQKIVQAARRISQGSQETLTLGNTSVIRDWGWAPEYVEAMHLMLQQSKLSDFVVATGESHSLKDFAREVFRGFGLRLEDHFVEDRTLFRPSDLQVSRADPSRILKELGWKAQFTMKSVVQQMSEAHRAGDSLQ